VSEPPVQIGDVAQLNTGGRAMVVALVKGSILRCEWTEGFDRCARDIPAAMVHIVRRKGS
jgi:uncharacterized protein YodC (DUF2158 family)